MSEAEREESLAAGAAGPPAPEAGGAPGPAPEGAGEPPGPAPEGGGAPPGPAPEDVGGPPGPAPEGGGEAPGPAPEGGEAPPGPAPEKVGGAPGPAPEGGEPEPDLAPAPETGGAPQGEESPPSEPDAGERLERAAPRRARKAAPVTGEMLRAAARRPKDIKEILREEAVRSYRNPVPAEAAPRPGSAAAPRAAAAAPPRGDSPDRVPAVAPPARGDEQRASPSGGAPLPRAAVGGSAPHGDEARAPLPRAAVGGAAARGDEERASTSGGAPSAQAPGGSAAAARPSPAATAPAARVDPAPTPPGPQAASGRADDRPAPVPDDAASRRGGQGPLVSAVLAVGVGLGALHAWQADRLGERLAALAPAAEARPAEPPPAPASPEPTSSAPSLAELGEGRVVSATPEGDLVVLRRDPLSGELEVERVYRLEHDLDRHVGDPKRRLHGYYLLDVEQQALARREAALAAYEETLESARRSPGTDVAAAERAAAALGRAGGADLLVARLEPEGSALERRTAAIGLAKLGYLVAVPVLAELLAEHATSPPFVEELCRLLERLTGLDLDPTRPLAEAERVRAWAADHPPADRFARVAD